MNVSVEIQTVASQVNGAQNSRLKGFIYASGCPLPFRINSGGEKIQKTRVDSSCEEQIRKLTRHGKDHVKVVKAVKDPVTGKYTYKQMIVHKDKVKDFFADAK